MDDQSDPEVQPVDEANNVTVRLSLTQDRGFIRRACPHCAREFKRLGAQVTASDQSSLFVCCYCYESALREDWWTAAQQSYFQAVMFEEAVAPRLRELQQSLKGMGTGGLLSLSFELTGVDKPAPIAPEESASMTRVEFPCHLDEPLRVMDDWEFDVACTICGTRYPIADVRRTDPAA